MNDMNDMTQWIYEIHKNTEKMYSFMTKLWVNYETKFLCLKGLIVRLTRQWYKSKFETRTINRKPFRAFFHQYPKPEGWNFYARNYCVMYSCYVVSYMLSSCLWYLRVILERFWYSEIKPCWGKLLISKHKIFSGLYELMKQWICNNSYKI